MLEIPEQPKAHWWNTFCKKHRTLDRYEFIDATYLDIIKYLPIAAVEEIEIEREMNPQMYKFMYLGEIDDLIGGAYAQFDSKRHYITTEQAQTMFAGETIEYIIFGGDGAISHDSTAICPIAIMTSGISFGKVFLSHYKTTTSTTQLVELNKDIH